MISSFLVVKSALLASANKILTLYPDRIEISSPTTQEDQKEVIYFYQIKDVLANENNSNEITFLTKDGAYYSVSCRERSKLLTDLWWN